ncbi:hypothetical protein PB1_08842 [Bacillus methanolicus PB1]|uniref:Uncharacterized protein n=1 Tax=Bacillus methanolicus PB1 TaxID=997296 RepID=I3E1T3_BACMT|nr:hypothetical protein PB1_08842 [Bacillus methanolicus PB1]
MTGPGPVFFKILEGKLILQDKGSFLQTKAHFSK